MNQAWSPSLGESAMVNEYDANQILADQSPQLSNPIFPPSADGNPGTQSALFNSSQWNIAPGLDNELSGNIGFPWTFQDGGIFGPLNGICPDLTKDKYFNPFGDNYYDGNEDGSTQCWIFVHTMVAIS
jgi:hypothetical protein